MYFSDWMKATDLFDLFADFYRDFDRTKAMSMCASLGVTPSDRLDAAPAQLQAHAGQGGFPSVTLGQRRTSDKQFIHGSIQLYLLDEPIAGVDPAARDFILNTILTNYNEEGTVMISTHLISDIELLEHGAEIVL